jgi:hypothetical protein
MVPTVPSDDRSWYALAVVSPLASYEGEIPDGATQAYVYVGAAADDGAAAEERIRDSAHRRGFEVMEFESLTPGADHEFKNPAVANEWRVGVASGHILWDTTYYWF